MLTGTMLACSARRFPKKTAIMDERRRLTYAELDAAANKFANFLTDSLRLSKGDNLGFMSRNRIEYCIALFGAARAGVVFVGLSTMYGPSDLTHVLGKSNCKALFYEDSFDPLVQTAIAAATSVKHVLSLGSGGQAFFDVIADCSAVAPNVELSEDDILCINFTGGTTGSPKGVLASHRARSQSAHAAAIETGIDDRDIVAVQTPLFHVGGLNLLFQPALLMGATIVLTAKWNVAEFVDLCEREKVSSTLLVPTQLISLLDSPDLDPRRLASWRRLSVGGAPISNETQLKMLSKFPDVQITQFYGQTEIGLVVAMRSWQMQEKLGACGRAVYNAEIAVVDPEGNAVGVGNVGEVVARGGSLMSGYYNEPELTAKFFRKGNGWGWTGDLGRLDDDGFLTIVDRADDMIISGGVNLYPKEVEKILYMHPDVSECAVFGVPDSKWGSVAAAAIKLAPGSKITATEITEFCLQHVSRLKCPHYIVFVEDFPRTPIGKIQKTQLRGQFAEQKKVGE